MAYSVWRVEAEHYFVYPYTPEGGALFALCSAIQQERWLPQMVAKLKGKGMFRSQG